MSSVKEKWVVCPLCSSKTRSKLREDSVVYHYPVFCPKCRQEFVIDAKELKIRVVEWKH